MNIILAPIKVSASAKILIIVAPLTFVDILAPIWAPNIAVIESVKIGMRLLVMFPLIRCTILPLKDMMATMNCDVAVAICTGKFNICTSAGTRIIPPPIPRRVDMNPMVRLIKIPGHFFCFLKVLSFMDSSIFTCLSSLLLFALIGFKKR